MDTKKRLLIVDDEADACESIGNFLKRRDYDITVAIGGKEAIAILKKETFPVVLLDLKMPVIDGWTVLKETKPDHPETKYLIVSGLADAGVAEKCKAAGAHDLVVKPIRVRDIYAMLEKLY